MGNRISQTMTSLTRILCNSSYFRQCQTIRYSSLSRRAFPVISRKTSFKVGSCVYTLPKLPPCCWNNCSTSIRYAFRRAANNELLPIVIRFINMRQRLNGFMQLLRQVWYLHGNGFCILDHMFQFVLGALCNFRP